MAHWQDCAECGGDGTVECVTCLGLGHELWDEEEILEQGEFLVVNEGSAPCRECLGDRELSCEGCFGEGGEWCE